jgi:hypothetical protein
VIPIPDVGFRADRVAVLVELPNDPILPDVHIVISQVRGEFVGVVENLLLQIQHRRVRPCRALPALKDRDSEEPVAARDLPRHRRLIRRVQIADDTEHVVPRQERPRIHPVPKVGLMMFGASFFPRFVNHVQCGFHRPNLLRGLWVAVDHHRVIRFVHIDVSDEVFVIAAADDWARLDHGVSAHPPPPAPDEVVNEGDHDVGEMVHVQTMPMASTGYFKSLRQLHRVASMSFAASICS